MEKMKKRNPGAISYFDKRIEDFDRIYGADKTRLKAFLDRTLRASVRLRFKLAFDLLGDMTGKSVLDIGCGTGRYMFEAVRRGATNVVGLDAAPGAIAMAKKMAAEMGFENRVQFAETDFMDFSDGSVGEDKRKYDVIFAVGYFDYIMTPQAHLAKMHDLCQDFLFASFPRLWHPMTPIRKIRLLWNKCPVRFYSESRIRKLLRETGYRKYELKVVARDYILIGRK
jgi:SAM-dependent methyltransferase